LWSEERVISIQSSLRLLVNVGLERTTWTASDLRPYQVLLWAFESPYIVMESFLPRILPAILCNVSQHCWSGSLQLFQRFTTELELPRTAGGDIEKKVVEQKLPSYGAMSRRCLPTVSSLSALGKQFRATSSTVQMWPFSTIENFQAREFQSRERIRLLARFSTTISSADPWELHFLLLDVIQMLHGDFPIESSSELCSLLRSQELLASTTDDKLRALLMSSGRQTFIDMVELVVLPLFGCLRRLWSAPGHGLSSTDYAVASLYLGLLRFHIFLPDSPLDPGLKPLAEVNLIKRRLASSRLEVEAMRIESGVVHGNFSPDHLTVRRHLDESARLCETQSEREKRVVERTTLAPPFIELYRETRDIAGRLLEPSAVLPFLGLLETSDTSKTSSAQLLLREEQWQRTTEAICERLLSTYSVYEDVVLPLVDSIGRIKAGLSLLRETSETPSSHHSSSLLALCTTYPFVTGMDTSRIVAGMRYLNASSKQRIASQRALSFAALSRLAIDRGLHGLDNATVGNWKSAISEMLTAETETGLTNEVAATSSIDVETAEFRAQFPDHRQEFVIVQDDEDDDDVEETSATLPAEELSSQLVLENDQIGLLCRLHSSVFAQQQHRPVDSSRTLAFRLSYGAACRLFEAYGDRALDDNTTAYSSHVMALTLCSSKSTFATSWSKDEEASDAPDFH
jgi:hypothetical protein